MSLHLPAAAAASGPTANSVPVSSDNAGEVVYFARTYFGKVKIGYTSNLRRRISEIQIGTGDKITVIRTIEGGYSKEQWLHKKFADRRIRGEWFEFHPDMMTIIPPDEIPSQKTIVIKRDVKLTVKEKLRAAERNGRDIGLSDKLILLSFASDVTDGQASEILSCLRGYDMARQAT